MNSKYDYIVSSLQKDELELMSLFAGAAKTRIGIKKRITLDEIVKGFKSKGHEIDREAIKRLCYHVQIRDIVPKLIYDGDGIWVADKDQDLHDYINAMWDWAEKTEDKRLSQILKSVSRAINNQLK